jgi:hypothetical protein
MFKQYFEPQELTFLTAVLERACLDAGVVEDSQREITAARIVRLAQTGEEDFEALRADAIKSTRGTYDFARSDSCTPAFFCNLLSAPKKSGLFQWIAHEAAPALK